MSDKTKLWFLEDYDLFQSLSEKEIGGIEESVFARTLKKNEMLRFPEKLNKYVYFLKHGVLKVMATDENGKEAIIYLIKPGNLFGEIGLFGDFEYVEEYAVAVEESVVCFIDAAKLKQWINENEDLRVRIFKQMGTRLQKMENRLLSMLFKDAQHRIYEFLIDFVKDFGTKTEEGYEVKNFLTNDDIAKLTATSRQTVNSVLNDLREKKWIDYNKDIISIPFSSELLKYSRGKAA
jgi:CRP/FNR family transcriptional regulator